MSKLTVNTSKKNTQNHFPVVGIGASVGSLNSLKKFIKTIPEDSGMAYIFLQNLVSQHEVALSDILQKISKIPVVELEENQQLSPNHLYLIPANKIVKAMNGELKLVSKNAKEKGKMPIDAFLGSLAEVYQANAIGILMSGLEVDGTLGLKDIKDNGGITFAQEPDTASHATMPQSAINAGTVDFVIIPEKISAKLAELRKAFTITADDDDATARDKIIEDCFQQIMVLLRTKVGVDFNLYKQTTVRRRIIRRMVMLQLEDIVNYLAYLKKNKSELDVLFQDLLIPVTSFFRDPATYDILCESVLPELINNKPADSPLRIWIAGCSTGQEAYSMAMCLHAYIESNHLKTKVQIFATDLSEKAIKKARSGTYSKKELQGVSDKRLAEFFTKKEGNYQIIKGLRDMCVFAVHNFIKDPPFAKMDFISCRNVMIYFEPFLQKKVLNVFHYALNEKGILLLGKSETIGSSSDIFAPFGKKDKFFIRKSVSSKAIRITSEKSETITTDKNFFMRSKEGKTDDFQRSAEDILLQKYSPVGVIVDEQYDIVQFRGLTGEYLEPSPGKASLNILKMAKEGLAFEIRNGLHQAKTTSEPFVKEGIPINTGKKIVTIDVIPLLNTLDLHYLILFRDTQIPVSEISKGKFLQSPSTGEASEKDVRIQQLEKELAQLREDMRSITEEQESINEELQSSNEELLSSSEELQSLNEELETSKEELQSTNEDLITVNQELHERNEELNQSRQFAEAIIAILHEPLLFLEKNFTIKDANEAFYEIFEINQQETIGKNLFALQDNGWNIPDLQIEINKVIEGELKMTEIEINFTFPKIGNRTICFNIQTIQQENKEPLILLALDDITERKNAEALQIMNAEKISKERQLLHGFLMESPAIFAILKGPDHVFEFANLQHLQYTGNRDIIGKKLLDAIPELEGQEFPKIIEQVYQTGESYIGTEMPASLLQQDGSFKDVFVNVNYQAIKDENGKIEGVLTFAYDVTELIQNRKHIKRKEKMIENMSNNSSVYMCTLMGADYTFTFVNEAYQKLFGKRQLLNKPLFEALPEFAGQGFESVLENVYTVGEVFLSGETPVWLSYDEGLEPVERFFNFSYQPIYDEDNQITGILVYGYEVTEQVMARKVRQEAVEKFSIVTNIMPQKINITDADGNVNYYNQQWYDYTGMSFEELKNFGWQKIVHPEDLETTFEKWESSYDTGTEFNLEQRFLRHDGVYRWHLTRIVPQKDSNGNIVAWIGAFTDIEEQKVKEQKKDEFISIASHEMKTPLTTAKAYLQLLEMSVDGDESSALYAKKASDAVDRLHNLITELLDASKIQNGQLNYNISKFNFSDMVKNTIEDVGHSFPSHQIIKKGKINKTFQGDENRLQQVVINLLTNAIKYAPKANEVLVNVEEEESQLTVSVTDKGIGMSKAHLEKVFDRYYRVQEHAIQFQGLGIGLYISHDIIIRHGGKMWVESELGKGSTFYFSLPFVNN
jgi:two-component system, chemotaxis family, CheB/CheR fusion protein